MKDQIMEIKASKTLYDLAESIIDAFRIVQCKGFTEVLPKIKYPRIIEKMGTAPKQYQNYAGQNMMDRNRLDDCSCFREFINPR